MKNKHKKQSSKNIFRKSAALQCANALPKSNARAHLKQRKNIVALPGRPVVTRPTTTRQVTVSLNQQACKQTTTSAYDVPCYFIVQQRP